MEPTIPLAGHQPLDWLLHEVMQRMDRPTCEAARLVCKAWTAASYRLDAASYVRLTPYNTRDNSGEKLVMRFHRFPRLTTIKLHHWYSGTEPSEPEEGAIFIPDVIACFDCPPNEDGLASLERLARVECLELSCCDLSRGDFEGVLLRLKGLTSLTINSAGQSTEGSLASMFAGAPGLQHLSYYTEEWTAAAATATAALPALRQLEVHCDHSAGDWRNVPPLPALTKLVLDRETNYTMPICDFRVLRRGVFAHLQVLECGGVHSSLLPHLARGLPQLRSLHCFLDARSALDQDLPSAPAGVRFDNVETAELVFRRGSSPLNLAQLFPSLRQLDLGISCTSNTHDMLPFWDSPWLQGLSCLEVLSFSTLEDREIKEPLWQSIAAMTQLHTLVIHSGPCVKAPLLPPSIQRLALEVKGKAGDDNWLTPLLAALPQTPNLSELDLRFVGQRSRTLLSHGPAQLASFVHALGHARVPLHDLYIGQNSLLSQEQVAALAAIPTLKRLHANLVMNVRHRNEQETGSLRAVEQLGIGVKPAEDIWGLWGLNCQVVGNRPAW